MKRLENDASQTLQTETTTLNTRLQRLQTESELVPELQDQLLAMAEEGSTLSERLQQCEADLSRSIAREREAHRYGREAALRESRAAVTVAESDRTALREALERLQTERDAAVAANIKAQAALAPAVVELDRLREQAAQYELYRERQQVLSDHATVSAQAAQQVAELEILQQQQIAAKEFELAGKVQKQIDELHASMAQLTADYTPVSNTISDEISHSTEQNFVRERQELVAAVNKLKVERDAAQLWITDCERAVAANTQLEQERDTALEARSTAVTMQVCLSHSVSHLCSMCLDKSSLCALDHVICPWLYMPYLRTVSRSDDVSHSHSHSS